MFKKRLTKSLFLPLTLSVAVALFGTAKQGMAQESAEQTEQSSNTVAGIVVYQSDFGLKDGAVSAMHGVAMEVSPELKISDLTHEIPTYNIWEASYRLKQTISYWPKGTVFVSVVDPGVGTERKSVVAKTNSGHYIVTPDNGTLTLVEATVGIAEVREIDEAVNRRKDSTQSYTFHGRDVYSYTGARLAAGVISFEEVGKIQEGIDKIAYQEASFDEENSIIKGTIPILDPQYGNVWTNISRSLFYKIEPEFSDVFSVTISQGDQVIYEAEVPYMETFGAVEESSPLVYINSLLDVSLALNMDNFAKTNKIGSGPEWSIEIKKVQK